MKHIKLRDDTGELQSFAESSEEDDGHLWISDMHLIEDCSDMCDAEPGELGTYIHRDDIVKLRDFLNELLEGEDK